MKLRGIVNNGYTVYSEVGSDRLSMHKFKTLKHYRAIMVKNNLGGKWFYSNDIIFYIYIMQSVSCFILA